MTWPKSWNDMELYHWLALGGGALAVLALVLAIAMRNRAAVRVPASVAAALAAFAAGLGAGVILLTGFGWHWEKRENPPSDPSAAGGGGGGPMMMRMGMPGGGGGGGGGRGGRGGRGGGGPSPKVQLTNLVDKLDVLTRKPLGVDLEGDKKKKVLEQLRDLGEKDELTDDEAKAKLDALLKVLEGDKATLEAVGYNWPGAAPAGRGGGRGGRGGAPPPNPFKVENNREHLKALQQRLEKGTAG